MTTFHMVLSNLKNIWNFLFLAESIILLAILNSHIATSTEMSLSCRFHRKIQTLISEGMSFMSGTNDLSDEPKVTMDSKRCWMSKMSTWIRRTISRYKYGVNKNQIISRYLLKRRFKTYYLTVFFFRIRQIYTLYFWDWVNEENKSSAKSWLLPVLWLMSNRCLKSKFKLNLYSFIIN